MQTLDGFVKFVDRQFCPAPNIQKVDQTVFAQKAVKVVVRNLRAKIKTTLLVNNANLPTLLPLNKPVLRRFDQAVALVADPLHA